MSEGNGVSPNCLLIPRKQLKFSKVDGLFKPVDSSIKPVAPFAISENGRYSGYKSGERSGIVHHSYYGWVKYKGCDVEYTLRREGICSANHGHQPKGGITFPNAENEIEITLKVNELLRENGIETAYEPLGVIKYPKYFRCPHDNDKSRMGAPVMAIKGDTRLVELFCYPGAKKSAALYVSHEIGRNIKKLMNVLYYGSSFRWGINNIHSGNFIIFEAGRDIHVNKCDFDVASFGNNGTERAERKIEIREIRHHLSNCTPSSVSHDLRYETYPSDLLHELVKGFESRSRKPIRITIDDLRDGFKIDLWRKATS